MKRIALLSVLMATGMATAPFAQTDTAATTRGAHAGMMPDRSGSDERAQEEPVPPQTSVGHNPAAKPRFQADRHESDDRRTELGPVSRSMVEAGRRSCLRRSPREGLSPDERTVGPGDLNSLLGKEGRTCVRMSDRRVSTRTVEGRREHSESPSCRRSWFREGLEPRRRGTTFLVDRLWSRGGIRMLAIREVNSHPIRIG